MKLYDYHEDRLSKKAVQAVKNGLFPGVETSSPWNPNCGEQPVITNLFLSDGEEWISPIDGKTTLKGEFVQLSNPLNGAMRISYITVKGEK